jgi:adenine-specific DNA-methyltransferase
MELFATDRDRLAFLLETDAALDLDFEALEAQAEAAAEEPSPEQRPKYITNYIGSKQKLVDWIWKHTPDGVESVVDAFSGSAVVAYMYKTKGLRVLANDRLRYCHHAARAIIENDNVRLSDEDLEALLADNAKAGTFVRDNFKGIFFAKGVHGLIDTIRSNIDKLSGFKKDIALFALGKTCMSGKGGFGHFSSSTRYGKREDTPEEFKERLRKNVARINALVFDNGKECKASRKDINDFLPEAKADLAYFDPPYATEFSTTNYEKSYHFVEGLMTYWEGLTLVEDSKTKHYETDHKTVTRANAAEFFESFLGNAKHIPHWLISYRDHAYPNESEMRRIIASLGRDSSMRSHDHHYAITSRHGEASHAKERLFICRRAEGAERSAKASTQDELSAEAVWEETENEVRYRVRNPDEFEPDSFRRKPLDGVDGVAIIIGRLKKEFVPDGGNPRSMVLQAYRFVRKTEKNPDGWTMEKAKEWIDKHEAGRAVDAALRVEENLIALADAPLGESLDLLSCQAGKAESVRVTGFMGSKYLMLGWIESHVPKDAESILDAFSGGANVAYHFKRKGLKVIANDLLRYPHHLARAVVENSSETLSDEDVDRILAPNADAGTFIVDHFYGYYYTKPVLRWLDQVWANIQKLHGYKKDLALAALGTTVKAKSAFGQFSRSKMHRRADLDTDASLEQSQLSNPPLSKFIESFRRSVGQLNRLVFDNGKECKAFNLDAAEAVRRFGADVLYLDPPYVTEFGSNDYEDSLHFIEGLMTRWADKELQDNPRRNYPSRTRYTKESIRSLMETMAADARGKYGTVLLSYRDRAYPREEEIKEIFAQHYGLVRVRGMEVDYNIAKDIGREGKHARELLFVASKSRGAARSKADSRAPAACHTSFPVELSLDTFAGLQTEAAALDQAAGDPQFTFILCRAGTNKNGDHFTPDELAARYMTAINKKIDLKHSQDFTDIVGGIVGADYVEDESGGRIECAGELYVSDSPHAQLAYKLIRKGIISQVSMECDYEEGECSICGKRVVSKSDYCVHLRKNKGGELQGQPVYEILHGVTFTGLGLLDRKGADENARILKVAAAENDGSTTHSEGGPTMDEKHKETEEREADAAKKKDDGGGGTAPDDKTRLKELERENKELKQQVLALQKQLEELEAERKAAANRSRAQKLLRKIEKNGLTFESDEEREQELIRLAGLSDDAFAASEAAFERMLKAGPRAHADDKDAKDRGAGAETAKASSSGDDPPLRSDAGVRPKDVEDKKTSLEDRLKSGFMAAYRQRVATATGEPVSTN